MSNLKIQESFYHVVFYGSHQTKWLADERIKKQFLDQLLMMQEKTSFRVYAFCVLDEEAHLLLGFSGRKGAERVIQKISQELQKCYRWYIPQGNEEVFISQKYLACCSTAVLLEHCCRIHLLASGYAQKLQDYWWSSYLEYLHKNITGLVRTEKILEALDADPFRAVQKFVQYHKKYSI